MNIVDIEEHLCCYNYDLSDQPRIEMVKIPAELGQNFRAVHSQVVFFMEGRLRCTFRNWPEQERVKGQMSFLPAGGAGTYLALSDTTVMIFRMHDNIWLCDNLPVEHLYEKDEKVDTQHIIAPIDINHRLWHFLDGVRDCLTDGVRCKTYFDLKIREFFTLLRVYYSKKQMHDFLYPILSPDTAFSEYVRLNWQRYKTAEMLADSMNLSYAQFSSRFKYVFGTTPRKWMMEGKARAICQELITTSKTFKQLAIEYDFSTVGHFARFCKNEFGKTPTEIRTGDNIK